MSFYSFSAANPEQVTYHFIFIENLLDFYDYCCHFYVVDDHTRVVLKTQPGLVHSDYINANYIDVSVIN